MYCVNYDNGDSEHLGIGQVKELVKNAAPKKVVEVEEEKRRCEGDTARQN